MTLPPALPAGGAAGTGPADDVSGPRLRALFARTAHGIRPGLDIIRRLLERRGHPERRFAAIHVAGTNGKGSVCAMLERLSRAAGLKTGLYTSPHLVSVHERIRVNGRPVPDAELARLIRTWESEAVDLERGGRTRPATFFEILTAMAFDRFAEERVDLAIVETGMGGRWDATNVLDPAVSVLCEIGLDHTEYLGRTLREIAREKAGILKAGRPAVCAPQDLEAMEEIEGEARAVGAPLRRAADLATLRRTRQDERGQRLRVETASGLQAAAVLPLFGSHQVRNAALAVAAFETCCEVLGLPLEERILAEGLSRVCWPARLQPLQADPPILLDAAHNPHGARALAGAIRELAGRRPVGLVAGLLASKDAKGFAEALAPAVRRVWAVDVAAESALPRAELAARFRAAGLEAGDAGLEQALGEAETWASERAGMVCVAGSLYLAGDVLKRRQGGDLFREPEPRARKRKARP